MRLFAGTATGTLYKISVTTDWKCRATHTLTELGTGTLEELVKLQDEDVAEWQKAELDLDNEIETEDAQEENREPNLKTSWADSRKWEMEEANKETESQIKLRMFCGYGDDGHGTSWSLSYIVLPIAE